MNADEPIAVSMTARIWAGIDAGVDNVVALAAQDGDVETVRFGSAIRRAGWDQVPWVRGEWPPFEQIISIQLTAAQWRFAAEDARRGVISYESLGDDVSAQLCRDALAVLEAAGVAGEA